MKSDNQNKTDAKKISAFSKMEKMHPIELVLYLVLAGITILFLVLALGFLRSEATIFRNQFIPFPRFFSVSTILLVLSSFTISKAPYFYRHDNLRKMGHYLLFTLFLSFGFMLCQVLGWYELAFNGVFLEGKPYGSYLYLISALHVLHLLGGVFFLAFMYFKTRFAMADAIRTLIFIRDPYRKLQLNILNTYWHYLDGLWGILFLIFLFCF